MPNARTDDEAHIRERSADARCRGDEQIDALAVRKARDNDNCDWGTRSAMNMFSRTVGDALVSVAGGVRAGVNWSATSAFGITYILEWSCTMRSRRLARRTVFSRLCA
jgi:hypothetical protein